MDEDETPVRFKRSKKKIGTSLSKKNYCKVVDEEVDEVVDKYVSKDFSTNDAELIDITSSDEYHLDDFMDGKLLTDESTKKDGQTSVSIKRFYGLVDESTDEDVDESTKHYKDFGNLLDVEAMGDGEKDNVYHLDDFSDHEPTFDDNTNDYDYSDSFINDEPLTDEDTINNSDSDK